MHASSASSLYERLLLPENLTYAWRKAKRLYSGADGYLDLGELAEFEVDLESRLRRIRDRFTDASHDPIVLHIAPRPKKFANDKTVDRQFFHVKIDDQVAWIALVNVIGPSLDHKMPPWSYGNRLYRAAWYETDDPNYPHHPRLELGPYRHQPGHLYRMFQHSWPLFRRHIALTAKAMARQSNLDPSTLDPPDSFALASATSDKLAYLKTDFWNQTTPNTRNRYLHYAAFDLESFYPGISRNAILNPLESYTTATADSDRILTIANDMLRFRVDGSGVPEATINQVQPPIGTGAFHGLPTGLFVSGFLANVAMLPVDQTMNQLLSETRRVAHFRFVDDHCVLAYDFDGLSTWISDYESVLVKHQIMAPLNPEKYSPASLGVYLDAVTQGRPEDNSHLRLAATNDTRIDGINPTPLMTQTLAQVSAIAGTDPNTLDDNDLLELLKRLEWLLLADIPEHELRPNTRMTFVAGRIAAFAPQLVPEIPELVDAQRLHVRLKDTESEIRVLTLTPLQSKEEQRHLRYYFELLLQAFRTCPENTRLFARLHQYCRKTGYRGISSIVQWFSDIRTNGARVWADYYSGLSLFTLAYGACSSAHTLVDANALRMTKHAALEHLRDIASVRIADFLVPSNREAWYQSVARRSAGVLFLTLSNASFPDYADGPDLCRTFARLSRECLGADLRSAHSDWEAFTGRQAGVWAHAIEGLLAPSSTTPSFAWSWFQEHLQPHKGYDRQALRRYPDRLSDSSWKQFVAAGINFDKNDAGWLTDSIGGDQRRVVEALGARNFALRRAGKSYDSSNTTSTTLTEWISFLLSCSTFDPRRSEWTALEIVRRLTDEFLDDRADDLHPNNILVPRVWRSVALSGKTLLCLRGKTGADILGPKIRPTAFACAHAICAFLTIDTIAIL